MEQTRFLSPAQVGQYFGVTTDSVRRMARNGVIPSVKLGRQMRIPASFIDRKTAEAENAVSQEHTQEQEHGEGQ